jgi:hypothetical protein
MPIKVFRRSLKMTRRPVIFFQSYIYKNFDHRNPMRTHRFGQKIELPATIAIKHQIRMLMAQHEVKKAEAQLIEQSARRVPLSTLGN